MTAWPAETIPDTDDLFMRVHRLWTRGGVPLPGAFQNRDGGMSTEWDRYSTPDGTRSRGRVPADNGVVKMHIGTVRALPNQMVVHTPESTNRAHTDVLGEKDEEVRLKFVRICSWVITPPSAPTKRISK
jgi:hypothetical protein